MSRFSANTTFQVTNRWKTVKNGDMVENCVLMIIMMLMLMLMKMVMA